jgi:hypothetical protein
MSFTEQIRLGIFVNTQQAIFERFARRNENDYAYFKGMKRKGRKKNANYSEDRYEALNWANQNTVEFRIFRGTLKHETILATLQMVHACVGFVKTISSARIADVEKAWNQFCDYVQDNSGRHNSHQYKELIEYLKLKEIWYMPEQLVLQWREQQVNERRVQENRERPRTMQVPQYPTNAFFNERRLREEMAESLGFDREGNEVNSPNARRDVLVSDAIHQRNAENEQLVGPPPRRSNYLSFRAWYEMFQAWNQAADEERERQRTIVYSISEDTS